MRHSFPVTRCMKGCAPKMLLYALDELFYVFSGVGAKDLDGQHMVAYEILSFASLHCIEW